MSKHADNLLVVFLLTLILALAVNLVGYNKGLRDGAKFSDHRIKQLETALKIHNIEIPKDIQGE